MGEGSGEKEFKEIRLPWWDHAVAIDLAQEYLGLRWWERVVFGFRVFAEGDEVIGDDGWGE